MKTAADWIALVTLAPTLATFVLVVLGELRHRRRFARVDFFIDHIGTGGDTNIPNGPRCEVFEITNCGTETATRIVLSPVGGKTGTAPEVRPIRVLAPGETKRFLVAPIDDLKDCWALISYFTATDGRFVNLIWEPLVYNGPLFDIQMENLAAVQGMKAWANRSWKRLWRKVEIVGPGAAPHARIRAGRGDRTMDDMAIASARLADWYERWNELDSVDSR